MEQQLNGLIADYEAGKLSFDEFSTSFSNVYLENADEMPDSETTRLFGAIHERLEWTTASPPEADRAWGWTDPEEFRSWLSSVRNPSSDQTKA